MTRDPFYQQIIAGLRGRLDPEVFERCAADLLRTIYPALVPVRGGCDGGMDGACADGRGPAYPLVTTTEKQVLRNLKRSVRSYRKEGGTRRKVIAATSQELTAKRRKNLETEARRLGFTLVNVHTQAAMADLLYRSPAWCLELLNLTSDPPPLSALPDCDRPALTSTLVGRQGDLDWLRDTPGDLLLVGQPGSGKTFLLSALAREGYGLFAVTDDIGRVTAGLRSQQPEIVLVDDAHLRCDFLIRLRRLRTETGASFRIVADCWPGDQDAVTRALGVTPGSTRQLGLLPRKEIVEVIHACGIEGPNPLVHELVRQADGRPGLAVTLCHLWLREGVREIALADALCRDVRTTFGGLVGPEAVAVLAAFAIGGEWGMPLPVVAEELGETPLRVRTTASRLAAGGVLAEAGLGCLAVRPEPLRHALVRDVFFNDGVPLPINGLLSRAPNPEGVVRTLVGARRRGGRVGLSLLAGLLDRSSLADETWEAFASLGEEESRWVLHEHPGRLLAVASVTLHQVPDETIPLLLANEAEGQARGTASSQPLQPLRQWVAGAFPGSGEPLERRETLLRAAWGWLDAGGDLAVTVRAVCLALSPDFQDWESDPGDRQRLIRRFGFVTHAEMAAIQALWPSVRQRLEGLRVENWSPFQELVNEWGWPGRMGVSLRRSTVRAMRQFTGRLLRDLARVARDRPAFLHWAHQVAEVQRVRLPVRLNPEFTTLYPFRLWGPGDWQQAEQKQAEAAQALALRWATSDPGQITRRLAGWEAEMNAAEGRVWPRWSHFVCQHIARETSSPGVWASALTEAGAAGDLVEPFLRRSIDLAEAGWEKRLAACLETPTQRGAAVAVVLTMPEPPQGLLASAVERAAGLGGLVWNLCSTRAMPESRAALLLRHRDRNVAVQAALGEWQAAPAGTVRPGLRAAWREAALRSQSELPEGVFRVDECLARDWLAARFEEDLGLLWQENHTAHAAYAALTATQRLDLLNRLPPAPWAGETVRRLVGDDPDLYRRLLADGRLRQYHLEPLQGRPEGAWLTKATLALEAGHTPEELADAVPWGVEGWGGTMSSWWAERVRHFEGLEGHPDPRIRRVGRVGREAAQARLDWARRRERQAGVHGDD